MRLNVNSPKSHGEVKNVKVGDEGDSSHNIIFPIMVGTWLFLFFLFTLVAR